MYNGKGKDIIEHLEMLSSNNINIFSNTLC